MKMEIWSGRSSDGSFRLYVSDDASNARFLEIKMTAENFALMLSNMPVECDGEVRNLERVGKKWVREERSVVYPHRDTDKKVVTQWLIDNMQEEGWTLNTYLGSQSSFVYNPNTGQYTINYSVEKWV